MGGPSIRTAVVSGVPPGCWVGCTCFTAGPKQGFLGAVSVQKLPISTPALCTLPSGWGPHTSHGERPWQPPSPSPPCRLHSLPVPMPATPLKGARPQRARAPSAGGQPGAPRGLCALSAAPAQRCPGHVTDRQQRDMKLSGFLLAVGRKHLGLSGSEREGFCQAGSGGSLWAARDFWGSPSLKGVLCRGHGGLRGAGWGQGREGRCVQVGQ